MHKCSIFGIIEKAGPNLWLLKVVYRSKLCFCGIQDGYRAAKKDFKLTLDDLADQFDGNWDCMENVFNVLADQMSDGVTEKKKKAKLGKKEKN